MSSDQPDPMFAPGDVVLERFRIVRLLGAGGMGEVYEAEDTLKGDTVALKIVLPELLGSDKTLARFEREVEWTRRISHPNVIGIRELLKVPPRDGDGGKPTPLLVMEYLEGISLADHLQQHGRFSGDEAKALVRQMAEALGAAHQAGIVHRDLKPDNVILVPGETAAHRVVLTDFGVARKGDVRGLREDSLTASNVILGTPEYMAPEMLELEEANRASDFYSLGLVYYEMVTGERPFQGERPLQSLFERVRRPAPSPRKVVPDLDRASDRVILRCLERRPEDRYPSARELIRDLDDDSSRTALSRPSREQLAAVVGLLGLLAMVGFLVWFYAR